MYCYQPKSGAVHAYFEQDGLPDNECNYLAHAQGSDGRLYFGTVKGLFSFYPDSLDAFNSETKIPLFVSGIDLWEPYTSKAVNRLSHFLQEGQLLIPAGTSHTSIHLSAPYFGQETVMYEWRIPGIVDYWQTRSTPVINIYQAPYGQYTLEVRVYLKGNESDQSIQSLRIPIEAIRPFYLRWWFIVLALTAVILSVWGWKWQRVRQIQERNRELKAIVLERTKDIQQQNILIQKQHTALQKLDEAKSRFFAHINHEFRTPLSVIYGYVEKLIRRTPTDAATTDTLLQIQRNVGSLKEMTEDMLEFARLDTAVLPVMPEPCHWPVFIRRIVSNFSGLAEDKEIRIETNQEDGIPEWLSLDIKKTERILNNLLANALKFTPEGGKVTLSVRAEGTMMCVRVDDSGVGIPPEDLPKVFDRYFQSESNLQAGRPGFGIGLSLCREYVALLGGDIAVQSTLGAGSTFTVRLPLHSALSQYEEPQKTERVIAKPEQVAAPIQPDKPAPHVLIVEDNKDMQQYLADLLSHDYRITKVYNGKEALALLVNPQETADIDLVLSDILMPQMNGFELLHAIRNHQDTATLPFIFLTALAETENIVNGLQIGVDSYLTKPFVPEEFEARIRNLLNYRQKRIDYVSPAKTVTKPLENIETTSFPPVEAYDATWLATLKAIVEKRLDEPGLKIESLASEMLVSERTLRNKIKAYTGLSPAEYLMKMRLAQALVLLEHRRYATISEVCHAVGLKNPSHFTKVFREEYGRLPSEYLR